MIDITNDAPYEKGKKRKEKLIYYRNKQNIVIESSLEISRERKPEGST